MDFDSWINIPSDLRDQISEAEEYVMERESLCQRTTINYASERVQISKTNNIENNILELIEARKKVDRLYDEYFESAEELRAFMYEVLPSKQADILDWRYCHVMPVEWIAERKKMTKQGVYQACHRAMINLKKEYYAKSDVITNSIKIVDV